MKGLIFENQLEELFNELIKNEIGSIARIQQFISTNRIAEDDSLHQTLQFNIAFILEKNNEIEGAYTRYQELVGKNKGIEISTKINILLGLTRCCRILGREHESERWKRELAAIHPLSDKN